jgi:hypothetical protein
MRASIVAHLLVLSTVIPNLALPAKAGIEALGLRGGVSLPTEDDDFEQGDLFARFALPWTWNLSG